MPNWKNLFLFVLQQFPWWVTENTGVLCFFVPLFLLLNVSHLYLGENVFGMLLLLLFWCFCTVGSCGTAGEEHRHISLQLLLPPSLPVPFLSHSSCCSTLLYPKKIPMKVTFTSCCWDRDFMACQARVRLLNSTCAELQVPKVLSCLFHQWQMTTGGWCVPVE